MMKDNYVDLRGGRELLISEEGNKVLLSITNCPEMVCYADVTYLANILGLRECERKRVSGVQWGIVYYIPFWKSKRNLLENIQEVAKEHMINRYEVVRSVSGRSFVIEKGNSNTVYVGTNSYLESNFASQLVVQSALNTLEPTRNFKNVICENGGMLIGVGFELGQKTYSEVKNLLQNYAS